MLRKFYKDLIIFLIPACVIVAYIARFWIAGFYSGELLDTDYVIEKQRENKDILIGMAYNEQKKYLKVVNANYYKPNIIALGTSRVMQFQEDFFVESFYNCGGSVSDNYDEYLNFLYNLSYTPKWVILGLDTWVFNDNWNRYCYKYDSFVPITKEDRESKAIVRSIENDYKNDSFEFSDLDNYSQSYGINGRVKNEGFEYDGSYYYGYVYSHPDVQNDRITGVLKRIEEGNLFYEWGDSVDDETIEELDSLLEYCKSKNIIVIGFLPPMAPFICKEMEDSGRYKYIYKISPLCSKLFNKHGYEFYDYWDSRKIGISDSYFIDGFHSSAPAHAIMLQDMIKKGSIVKHVVDDDKLSMCLEKRYSDLCFDEPN